MKDPASAPPPPVPGRAIDTNTLTAASPEPGRLSLASDDRCFLAQQANSPSYRTRRARVNRVFGPAVQPVQRRLGPPAAHHGPIRPRNPQGSEMPPLGSAGTSLTALESRMGNPGVGIHLDARRRAHRSSAARGGVPRPLNIGFLRDTPL
jgi:hypothetical protein